MTKTSPDLTLEESCGGIACGIDEAGRGPLAGPVVAACVYIPEHIKTQAFWRDVNDSKKLTAKKRMDLFSRIKHYCHFGVGTATPEEIDDLNIHHATLTAMRRSYDEMLENYDIRPNHELIDGKFTPKLDCRCQAVIKGDSVSLSIAAASIIAKVTRDLYMAELHKAFPAYGWERNAGYGTKQHLTAIAEHGITEHHRRSYAPCAQAG